MIQFDAWMQITKNGDGGDSAANAGTFLFCNWVPKSVYERIISPLEYFPSSWRRHPDNSKWYAQPGMERMSRDQFIPLICAMGAYNDWKRLLRLMLRHSLHGFLFAFNVRRNHVYKDAKEHTLKSTPDVAHNYSLKMPDLTLFEFFGLYVRALHLWPLYPLLFLSDLETLLGSIVKYIQFKKGTIDIDCRNHIMVHLNGHYRMITPLIAMSWYVYSKTNPMEQCRKWFTRPYEPELHLGLIKKMKEL